jgi:hypothetical protein
MSLPHIAVPLGSIKIQGDLRHGRRLLTLSAFAWSSLAGVADVTPLRR